MLTYSLKIIGGKYIEIGFGFYCGPDSRLEAWDYYKPTNQKFTLKIIIGNNIKINGGCQIGAMESIRISDTVLMGNGVFLTDHAHGNSTIDEEDMHPNDRKSYSKVVKN